MKKGMQKEFIVIKGDKFTIEWYYDDRGKSTVFEYFEELDSDRQGNAFKLFRLMANMGKIHNIEKFRNEEDKIFTFKPKPDRFLCFFYKDSKIIITNAFEKKCTKMPATEKQKALRAMADYIKRYREGTYYD